MTVNQAPFRVRVTAEGNLAAVESTALTAPMKAQMPFTLAWLVEDGLAALEVRSPYAGIVMLERDWRGNAVRVGDTVWPGRPLARIPDLAEMQAEVFVLEADAGDLAEGQTATVWLEASPEVELTCRRVEVEPFSVLSEGRTVDATAHGVDASFADLTNLRVSTGRFFDDLDVADHAQVCVIGEGVRRELFGYEEGVGQVLKVNQLRLEIVGVIEDSAGASTVQGVSVGSTNLEIYLPVTTAIRKLDLPLLEAPLDEIIVRLAGVVVGVVISKVVAVSAGWSTVVTLWSVVLAFGVSMAVGIGSGLYPAQRAAKLNPTDALRWD